MSRIIHFVSLNMKRSRHYFEVLQDDVMVDNYFVLLKASIASELVLIAYGIFAIFAFKNQLLNIYYLCFILLNSGLIMLLKKKKEQLTFRFVQNACRYFLIQMFSFIIMVSVFPFPDRPAIFYSPVYLLLLMLFQFPCIEIFLFSTVVNIGYIMLTMSVKAIADSVYDVTAAITAWLLGLIMVALLGSLRLRSGEARLVLQQSSRTDYLTGLANRREMDRQFSKVYEMCKQQQVSVSAFMLDVDYFKRYNDHFGHEAGDLCLAHVGEVIRDFIDERGYYLARYGGEEFVVLLAAVDEKVAEQEAQTLLERLRFKNPEGMMETFSMGITVEIPDGRSSIYDLIQKADHALYQAKASGRNQYVIENVFKN